jgi:A nuclease family of the HNH/ENDO VII superfamily with conserved AHH
MMGRRLRCPLGRRPQPLPNPGEYIETTYGGFDALGKKKPGSNMPHVEGNSRPHGHHIVPQGRPGAAEEAREILRKVGLDPIRGQENLVWAPDWGYLNTGDYAEQVLKRLQKAEQTKEGITGALERIARIVARGERLPKLR